jgi:glutathione S-transferase
VSLVLHQHPFASYCQKVLIALYELELPFSTQLVDGADARAQLAATLWPMASVPVLRDESADLTLPESTTIIEYLDALAANGPKLLPASHADALQARLWDASTTGT